MNEELKELNVKKQEAMDGSSSKIGDESGYIHIKFQCGPIKEVGVNGTSIENVLNLLKNRLEGFQKGDFRCRENAIAITKIEEAMQWLEWRTSNRIRQGVEGLNKAHVE